MAETNETQVVKTKKSAKEFWAEHKKLGKSLKISGIVAGVAALATGGFFLFKKFRGEGAAE